MCSSIFFSVERALAGVHEAPGAQTSLCGAQIEKNIYFFFQLKRVPAGTPNVKRAPAGAHEAPGAHSSKILYISFSYWRGPQLGPRRFIVKIPSDFYRWNEGILTTIQTGATLSYFHDFFFQY